MASGQMMTIQSKNPTIYKYQSKRIGQTQSTKCLELSSKNLSNTMNIQRQLDLHKEETEVQKNKVFNRSSLSS